MYTDRLLPHDIEAEESLIGSILIDAESKPTDHELIFCASEKKISFHELYIYS